VSSRNADFLHNEVPGMSIPEAIRERMAAAGSGPPARAEGVAIAREMLDDFKDRVVGCYIMPQLGRYELAVDILQGLGYGSEDAAARRDAADAAGAETLAAERAAIDEERAAAIRREIEEAKAAKEAAAAKKKAAAAAAETAKAT
jgi:hypothetical protein